MEKVGNTPYLLSTYPTKCKTGSDLVVGVKYKSGQIPEEN
jgi:hypothetical protein